MNWIFSKVVLTGMILGILAFPVEGVRIKYEVTALDGYVAVRDFQSGEIQKTSTRIVLLPREDQLLLPCGIPCPDEQTLLLILENFCS